MTIPDSPLARAPARQAVWNFSAGPAALPAPVLARIREELLDWQGSGCSVMELSHRGAPFMALAEASEARLRRLAAIPDDYAVLFLQGGASTQFAVLPLNYAAPEQTVAFVDSGHWAVKAQREATKLRATRIVERLHSDGRRQSEAVSETPAYVHCTSNETVDGVRPAAESDFATRWADCWDGMQNAAPVFCDMSSDILSRPLDLSPYGLIYAGAQKNLGPAGLTLVLVRRELLERCPQNLPTLLNHSAMAASGSMANTPPTFAWYVCDLVFQWLEDEGGLEAIAARNAAKAAALYRAIDASDYYRNEIAESLRSDMNVVFSPPAEADCPRFVAEAEAAGLIGLKGHRAVGGLRASLYNAMPLDGVEALIQFMADFERRHG